MKATFLIFVILYLTFSTFTSADDSNLWDLVVKQDQVLLAVTYRGRTLSVWRQQVSGQQFSRFYVTPLCIFDSKDVSCDKDAYSTGHPWIFNFKLTLWDLKAADVVKNALKEKGFQAETSDIFILPMQKIRTGIDKTGKKLLADKRWRPNQDQQWVIPFEMYPNNNNTCQQMLQDVKNNTEKFLNTFRLYFEFSMVASQIATRNISISGQFLQKSAMFNSLKNQNADEEGTVYLTSKDINKLAHDIVNQATFQEEVSSDYVPAENEDAVINALLQQFQKDKVQSESLSAEKWGSVFWNDIFTRPDIQTDFLNKVLKIDKSGKSFKYDKEAEKAFQEKVANEHTESHGTGGGGGISIAGFGISAEASVTNAHGDAVSNAHGNKTRNALSFNDVQKALKKDNMNVKWSGKKFEQKNLDLYRMNTRDLSSQSSICFLRTTITKQESSQKIHVNADPNVSSTQPKTAPAKSYVPPVGYRRRGIGTAHGM
uniref:Uncharacterized protein n=1 Tax=Panagrolaimus sp. ES5 TaxID=591445 RepID=A0AC34FA24_9BILA